MFGADVLVAGSLEADVLVISGDVGFCEALGVIFCFVTWVVFFLFGDGRSFDFEFVFTVTAGDHFA